MNRVQGREKQENPASLDDNQNFGIKSLRIERADIPKMIEGAKEYFESAEISDSSIIVREVRAHLNDTGE